MYLSPGVLASFDLIHGGAWGLGGEVSYDKWFDPDVPNGAGAFANGVYYFTPRRGRLAAGAQAHYWGFGAEAGWAYLSGASGAENLGPATGPFVGGFLSAGYFLVALRGSFASFGDADAASLSLDLGYKMPLAVTSRGVENCLDPVPIDASH